MEMSVRPWLTSGVALIGVGAIAVAPIQPSSPAVELPAPTPPALAEVQLTSLDIPYILTLPIVRARIESWAQNWAVYLGGLALSGIGVVESLAAIPGQAIEIIQQIIDLDFAGAYNTFTTAVGDAVVAIGEPLVQSWVWRGQKAADQQSALYAAYPQAIVDVGTGVVDATNVVVSQALAGTQAFIEAVLTFNLGNIIDAAIQGISELIGAVGDGAGLIVGGIESAQMAIANAWKAGPPPPFSTAAPEFSVATVDALPSSDAKIVSLDAVGAGSEVVSKAAPQSVETAAPEEAPGEEAPSEKASEKAEETPKAKPVEKDEPQATRSNGNLGKFTPGKLANGPVKDTLNQATESVTRAGENFGDTVKRVSESVKKAGAAAKKAGESAKKAKKASVGAGDSDD